MKNCKNLRMLFSLGALAALVLTTSIRSSRADFVTWDGIGSTGSGSSLHNVDVTVIFDANGTDLKVTLLSNLQTVNPVQALSGLVWDINGTAITGTTFQSAKTGSGSDLYTSATVHAPSTDLRNSTLGGGDGWQYEALVTSPLLVVASHQYQYGLGASGLGGTFGGLGNADYGIVGPLSTIGSNPLKNQLPLIMNTGTGSSSAEFVIHNYTGTASNIKDVLFMFGSAGGDNVTGHLRSVPEPGSLALMLMGSGAFGAVHVARKRRAKKASENASA